MPWCRYIGDGGALRIDWMDPETGRATFSFPGSRVFVQDDDSILSRHSDWFEIEAPAMVVPELPAPGETEDVKPTKTSKRRR